MRVIICLNHTVLFLTDTWLQHQRETPTSTVFINTPVSSVSAMSEVSQRKRLPTLIKRCFDFTLHLHKTLVSSTDNYPPINSQLLNQDMGINYKHRVTAAAVWPIFPALQPQIR